jgi:hypothetical protein
MLNYKAAMIENAHSLRQQTHQALQDGYYPIVIGGDKTQAIGSVSGMKKLNPNAKLIMIDSDESNSTLAYLEGRSGLEGYKNLECIDRKDIAFIGVSDADLSVKDGLIIGQNRCKSENLDEISTLMSRYFRKENESSRYWISFDASSLSSQDFKSALMKD